MPKATYYIYQEKNTNSLRVYPQEQELHRVVSKKQFRGWDKNKKAKIEAIYRLTGERLPDEATADQIKEYVTKNIYSTPKWMKYREIYSSLYMNEEAIKEDLEFISKIEVVSVKHLIVENGRVDDHIAANHVVHMDVLARP